MMVKTEIQALIEKHQIKTVELQYTNDINEVNSIYLSLTRFEQMPRAWDPESQMEVELTEPARLIVKHMNDSSKLGIRHIIIKHGRSPNTLFKGAACLPTHAKIERSERQQHNRSPLMGIES